MNLSSQLRCEASKYTLEYNYNVSFVAKFRSKALNNLIVLLFVNTINLSILGKFYMILVFSKVVYHENWLFLVSVVSEII